MPITETELQEFKQRDTFSVYLCGPIANCTNEQIHGWRKSATEKLAPYPIIVYDPTVRDYQHVLTMVPTEDLHIVDNEIVTKDIREIIESDVLLCNCHIPSAGSSMEICLAWMLKKFVITIVPSIRGTSSWIRYHSNILIEDFSSAESSPLDKTINVLKETFPRAFLTKEGKKDL